MSFGNIEHAKPLLGFKFQSIKKIQSHNLSLENLTNYKTVLKFTILVYREKN